LRTGAVVQQYVIAALVGLGTLLKEEIPALDMKTVKLVCRIETIKKDINTIN